jgi:hypothetical protein
MILVIIHGNMGTMTLWHDNEGEHRPVNVEIQQTINDKYIGRMMEFIPDVIKQRYQIKSNDLPGVPNNNKPDHLTSHHFFGNGVMPIPTVLPVPFTKCNAAHKLMMETYQHNLYWEPTDNQ